MPECPPSDAFLVGVPWWVLRIKCPFPGSFWSLWNQKKKEVHLVMRRVLGRMSFPVVPGPVLVTLGSKRKKVRMARSGKSCWENLGRWSHTPPGFARGRRIACPIIIRYQLLQN